MNSLKQWVKVHSPTAQTASAIWLLLTTLWMSDAQFHDYIVSAFNALPKGIHAFMVGVVIPTCILWRSQRKNVAVAEASPGESGTASAKATVKSTEPNP